MLVSTRCPSIVRDVNVEGILCCRSMAEKKREKRKEILNNCTYNIHIQLLSSLSSFSFILPSFFPL
jgi:hypothetical protein